MYTKTLAASGGSAARVPTRGKEERDTDRQEQAGDETERVLCSGDFPQCAPSPRDIQRGINHSPGLAPFARPGVGGLDHARPSLDTA